MLLKEALRVDEFVNADSIARGLAGFEPDRVALPAGRLMLERIRTLVAAGRSFAFETTLASRSFASWLKRVRAKGYESTIVFLWLPTPEQAIARVKLRAITGGHSVTDGIIRRRYFSGIRNLLDIYMPLVDEWFLYDNQSLSGPRLVAYGRPNSTLVVEPAVWQAVRDAAHGK